MHYHNHAHELQPNQDGLVPRRSCCSARTSCWRWTPTGPSPRTRDPVAFLREHKDRIQVVHLKDGKGGDTCASLGQGIAPVAAVRQAAIELGLTMVVESEGPGPHRPGGVQAVHRLLKGRGPEGRELRQKNRGWVFGPFLYHRQVPGEETV